MQHGIKTARAVVKRNRELRKVGNDFFLRKAKEPKRRPATARRDRGPVKGPADRGRGLSGSGHGVVSFAGANVEPLAADANFDGVIILSAIVATRIVAEGVLV